MHKYSCVSCHKRKVKCDRLEPCGYCARHDEDCVYQDPLPPRKRKRPADSEEVLRARRQLYETQQRSEATVSENQEPLIPPREDPNNINGHQRTETGPSPGTASVTPQGSTLADALRDASRGPTPGSQNTHDGRLITDRGKTRYLEK